MEFKQSYVFYLYAASILIIMVFPPFHAYGNGGATFNLGYSFILDPPSVNKRAVVNIELLFAEIIAATLFFGAIRMAIKKP